MNTMRSRLPALTLGFLAALALASCSGTNGPSDSQGQPGGAAAGVAGADTITVPDVTEQDGDDAQSQLEDAGLDVSYEPDRADATECHVTDQDPPAGAELDPESDVTEITLTLDCRQTDWQNQEGDDWDTFNSAYSDGWDTGCDDVFNSSPDGSTLHYDGEDYTSIDCQNGNPGDASGADLPDDVPDDPQSDGEALGEAGGCAYVFTDLAPTGALYYGTEQFTDALCPGGGAPAATAPEAKPAPKPSALSAAGYRVTKTVWERYSLDKQRRLAQLFVANNPTDCGVAPASLLPRYMRSAWGTDYPVIAKANAVMLGFCKLAADGE
jgi:hypothetical protein